jgi:hypothetical protein
VLLVAGAAAGAGAPEQPQRRTRRSAATFPPRLRGTAAG